MPRTRNTESNVNVIDPDVETVDPSEVEETSGPEASAEGEKAPTAKKEPARGDLPEGYVTPVGLAKILGERGLQSDRDGNVLTEVKPQMVYSYIKNAPKEHPFPLETVTDSIGKERQAVKVDEAVAWWEAKNERTATRKANAQAKADAKAKREADKASKPTAEAEGSSPSEPAVEAE